MNILLSPQAEEMIERQVAAGVYDDASEMVEEALSLLNDQQRFLAFKVAVEAGFAEPDDEDIPFTPELFDDIRQTARRLVQQGHTPNPDVCP